VPFRRQAAALAACAAVLVSAAPADAYVLVGRPWPTRQVTYTTQTPAYAASVDRAARIINSKRIGVTIRRVASNPDITFVYRGKACDGRAQLGYQPRRADKTVWLGAGCSTKVITLTAVHELGHVLGLDHENSRCARMNPVYDKTGTPNRCAHRSVAYWLRHPLMSDDMRGLRALY
jgi:hypothetical protein